MKLDKNSQIIIAVALTALVVGVAFYLWHVSVVRSTVKRLQDEQQTRDRATAWKDVRIKDLRNQIKSLEDKLAGSVTDLPASLLKIYSYNPITDVRTVGFCLEVPDNYTLVQKLNAVAGILTEYHFARGAIKVRRIEKRKGESVAVVDLRETKAFPHAWKGGYFQGSSGGTSTTFILTNTFLQPDYSGTWVGGVEFLYEGDAINPNEWDHISLDGTKYRQ